MKKPRILSAAFIRNVNRPGRYGDGRGGHGLSLLVKRTANGRLSKTWAQRLRKHGKPFNVGLGIYPLVTLAEARQAALANRRALVQGHDPRGGGIPTFEQAAEKVIRIHAATWTPGGKSEVQWRASLRDYAMPILGHIRLDKITTADVLAVLLPIWNEKRETARRVRQRIGAIMKWAVAQNYRQDNPAGEAIGAALPKNGVHRQHHKALPHGEVGAAIQKVRQSGAYRATVLAFEFIVLTACRSGEVRGARWKEVDLSTATWTIPGKRMKTRREHRVPLSKRALQILNEALAFADGSGLVFPSLTGRTLSDSTISKLLREIGIPAVPHGFRSSFRDWCGDNGAAREVAEPCLAHTVKGVEGAYFRSDLYARRAILMEEWAQYQCMELSKTL